MAHHLFYKKLASPKPSAAALTPYYFKEIERGNSTLIGALYGLWQDDLQHKNAQKSQ